MKKKSIVDSSKVQGSKPEYNWDHRQFPKVLTGRGEWLSFTEADVRNLKKVTETIMRKRWFSVEDVMIAIPRPQYSLGRLRDRSVLLDRYHSGKAEMQYRVLWNNLPVDLT